MKFRWNTRFSRIENLWPWDSSCPLPLRSKRVFSDCFRIVKTQKISRGCAAHIRESPFAPNEVPAPVLQRRWLEIRYHVRTAHEIFKVLLPKKENTAHAVQAKDFVGSNRRQNDRVCCGAVNLSGIIHGEAVFKMNTTTSCGWFQTNPQNQWDLQGKYHCM